MSTSCAIGHCQGHVIFAEKPSEEFSDFRAHCPVLTRLSHTRYVSGDRLHTRVDKVHKDATQILAVSGLANALVLKAIEVAKQLAKKDDLQFSFLTSDTAVTTFTRAAVGEGGRKPESYPVLAVQCHRRSQVRLSIEPVRVCERYGSGQ